MRKQGKKLTEFKGFYEVLKENLQSYRGEFDEIVFVGPELFKLLTNLLEDGRAKKGDRLMINAAVAYFVSPYDVIPEAIYGPLGYLDDIFLCTHVLKRLKKKLGSKILEDNWEGEEDLNNLLEEVYEKSQKALGKEKVEDILVYSGLK